MIRRRTCRTRQFVATTIQPCGVAVPIFPASHIACGQCHLRSNTFACLAFAGSEVIHLVLSLLDFEMSFFEPGIQSGKSQNARSRDHRELRKVPRATVLDEVLIPVTSRRVPGSDQPSDIRLSNSAGTFSVSAPSSRKCNLSGSGRSSPHALSS